MSVMRWMPVAIVAAAVAMAGRPVAQAEPVFPVAGGEPADQTISDLTNLGYDVQINWIGGQSNVSLSQCSVKGIHNPDGPPTGRDAATVYVDVDCPGNSFD
jgi:hypothetical protein